MNELPLPKQTVLLIGGSGTGKTESLATLLDAGQKVRIISVDVNCPPVLRKVLQKRKTPLEKGQLGLYMPPKEKISAADMIGKLESNASKDFEVLLKQKELNRSKYDSFVNVWKGRTDFKDFFTGESLGRSDDWGADTTLCIDSLTAVCEGIKTHTVGTKVGISQPEWGAMQTTLINWLNFILNNLECNIVLLAHPDKGVDPNVGGQKIYPSNLGQALNSLIPAKFGESVKCYRTQGKDGKQEFYWSVIDEVYETRFTNLPPSAKIPQDFSILFK